jgi:spore germination protein GerM
MMRSVAGEGAVEDRRRVRWHRRATVAVIRFAVVLVVSATPACGVPAEDDPRPIEGATAGTSSAPGQPAGMESGPAVETLYFVRNSSLVAVRRAGPRLPSVETQLEHLLAGPTDPEHQNGLSSALTGLGITAQVRIDGTAAVVDVGNRPDRAGRSDEVLAYGQIVCTLTAGPDVETVIFQSDGQPVDVPRADGSLGRRPLAAADYASLVVVP